MTYRAIPKPGPGADPALSALKENFEILTGQRGEKIQPLPAGATLADAIAKINEIIAKVS